MPRVYSAALAFGLLCLVPCLSTVPVRGDDDPYNSRHADYVVEGVVQSVNRADDRLAIAGTDNHRYIVDAYAADIILRPNHSLGETLDLARGMRVEVTGTLLGRNLLEAARLRVLPSEAPALAPVVVDPLPLPAPALPMPVEAAPAPAQPQLNLDGLVRDVDTVRNEVSFLSDEDKRYTLDTRTADIILRGTERAGLTADLTRGMRIRLVGALLPSGLVEADRIRVLPAAAAEAPAPIITPVAPVAEDMSIYTGILIDARALPRISRSPAPAIYGALPDQFLLYPDRSHVPTPDEVQEESIVRYYHTEADADAGVAGTRPLILTAERVLGPAEDAVRLTPEDAARFLALDKRLHFTRTWKVGFLIPANQ